GLQMDAGASTSGRIKREMITAENINSLFNKYAVPNEWDLLSIDIDGNDLWVWKAIDPRYQPRVVIVEYNAKMAPTESKTIAYDPAFRLDGTDYFGASLLAFVHLAEQKGYQLVACEGNGVNAFFVRKDVAQQHFIVQSTEA